MIKSFTKKVHKRALIAFGIIAAFAISSTAVAINAPAAGDFAYDLYDVLVLQGLQGAPGFVAGIFGVIWASSKLASNWLLAVLGILGSTAMLKAEGITTSLGYLF